MFYRMTTDGLQQPIAMEGLYSGPTRSTCWIVGGGPSLNRLQLDPIHHSPAPIFSVNLAGTGLLRPTFWTSYDATTRFHKSIFLDPSVIKFQHRSRAMDLIPETTYKVCDAPATLFFERSRDPGFHSFPSVRDPAMSGMITDWQDSLIQAIDIAWHLGFRRLILVGCEMCLAPDARLQSLAESHGVEYQPRELLSDFIKRCQNSGISQSTLDQTGLDEQYHFAETKPLAAAIQTDFHYFRICQYLRLSRRAMISAGLELISATPHSRLNDDFEFQTIDVAAQTILDATGNPSLEQTQGRYTSSASRQPATLGPMRDFKPHFWNALGQPPRPETQVEAVPDPVNGRQRLRHALNELPEIAIDLKEDP